MSDLFFGIVIGFLGNWLACAVGLVIWVAVEALANRRQRRRGRAGW